jgi:hypothetical protein
MHSTGLNIPRGAKRPETDAIDICSRFVFWGLFGATRFEVSIDLQTVICQVPSVSRAIVASAKLQVPADASKTLRWRPFSSSNFLKQPIFNDFCEQVRAFQLGTRELASAPC